MNEGEGKVHSSGKLEAECSKCRNRSCRICRNRQPDQQHHHRDGYGQRNPSESSARDRGRRNYHRRGHVRGPEGRLITLAGNQNGGFRRNIPEAPFSFMLPFTGVL